MGNQRLLILALVLCWTLGVFILLVRRLAGVWFLGRLRRAAVDVQGPAAETFAACRVELGVRGTVRLMTHPQVRSPVLFGLFRPAILVPPDWPQLPVDVQRAALLHELAHLQRRDHWLVPLMETIRVAFFFHPLVRWLLGRLEYERELLCDEMVVGRGVDRRDYARMLLEFARQSGRFALPRLSGSSYLPIGRRRTVKARINHLLEENMERWMGSLPARWAVVLGVGLLTLSLGLASYRVRAVEPEEPMPVAPKEKKAAQKPSVPKLMREALRYGGKNFDQWHTEMVAELKPEVRADGMKAFGAFGANGYGPEATQAILEVIRGCNVPGTAEDDALVVIAGYQAIHKIGAPSIPALTAAVKRGSRNVRRFAIEALGVLGTKARSEIFVVWHAMKNEDAETRRRALHAVYDIDKRAKGFVPVLIEALEDEETRQTAIQIIIGVGKEAQSALPALIELRERNQLNTSQITEALHTIAAGKEAVVPVTRLLQDMEFKVQYAACQFLQSLGADAKEAVPILIEKLKDPKSAIRIQVTETLANIGPAAKKAIPVLNELLRYSDGNLRSTVVNALGRISPGDDSR